MLIYTLLHYTYIRMCTFFCMCKGSFTFSVRYSQRAPRKAFLDKTLSFRNKNIGKTLLTCSGTIRISSCLGKLFQGPDPYLSIPQDYRLSWRNDFHQWHSSLKQLPERAFSNGKLPGWELAGLENVSVGSFERELSKELSVYQLSRGVFRCAI